MKIIYFLLLSLVAAHFASAQTTIQDWGAFTNEKLANRINFFRGNIHKGKLDFIGNKCGCNSELQKIAKDYDKYNFHPDSVGKGFRQCYTLLPNKDSNNQVEVITSFATSTWKWNLLMNKSARLICACNQVKDNYRYILIRVY